MIGQELICIGCPLGCVLQVEMEKEAVRKVMGHTCKRGEAYARKEMTNPTRIVTSTVRVRNGRLPVVSVKTRQDIPKGKLFDCMEELKEIELLAPVYRGEIIKKNIAGTGIDVIATKEVGCDHDK